MSKEAMSENSFKDKMYKTTNLIFKWLNALIKTKYFAFEYLPF